MKYFLSLAFICTATITFAQKAQNEYFFTDNGLQVYSKDSADFIRVIIKLDSSTSTYELKEYFKNGNIKRTGTLLSLNPKIKLEGLVTDFYPNGNKKAVNTYRADTLKGESWLYYENGTLNEKRYYTDSLTNQNLDDKSYDDYYLIKYKSDSLGHSFLDANGSGDFKISNSNGDYITGTYLNGLKHSNWETLDSKKSRKVQETYVNGKFISGNTILSNGKTISFTKRMVLPEFIGGQMAFGNFIAHKFKYSKMARSVGVEGKVVLSFVIDKEGTLTDIKILRDLGFGTGQEAARVLASSPKWKPGYQYGIPVRVVYSLPIALKLDTQ
ncbi:MAG: hypothetical protein JWQ25_1604 [Daejeonella sp.]|nr:hypothetical protein [Daejeonella sp.]